MIIQEEAFIAESDGVVSSGNAMVVDVGTQSGVGEGHVPKIRKPYTITKQRERWTEEEHSKFLQALKLYGRAWRKIEEHVGSKTAVQIRSHAQKFFSKVVRETNDSNQTSTEPIEIPPPRPKRKPSHPYPRKFVLPHKTVTPLEQLPSSPSPHSSMSEQENQSPTSVLSSADTLPSADSITPNSSPLPMSSADAVNQDGLLAYEDNASQDDVPVSQSAPRGFVSVKLELFPSIDVVDKPELPSSKVLKLFGKDVVIPNLPSLSKSPSLDMGEGVLQASPENSQPADVFTGNGEIYEVGGSGNQVEKPTPLPWWVFFKGMATPLYENVHEKDSQREGSSAGSSSELVNAVGNPDNNSDAETESDKWSNRSEELISETKPCLLEKRKSMDKGFVPYKRCFSERDRQSSTISDDEKDILRIGLFL